MIYANPGSEGSVVSFKPKYENYINVQCVATVKGNYFTKTTTVTGEFIC
jgi:aldehyde dehydrogenase